MSSNGSLSNALTKLLQGYHSGRDVTIDTCYNWVGHCLREHAEPVQASAIIRFWGLARSTLEQSLIVHGDAIVETEAGWLLISDAVGGYYDRLQLVAEYRWLDVKNYYRLQAA